MIDHLSLAVKDLARSRQFYTQALEPLGYAVQMEHEEAFAFGPAGKPVLWFRAADAPAPMHLAFAAPSRAAVDAFFAAALAAGGSDNGGPGVRAHYHPTYYGAFVLDPDGHNVEAVCHGAPGGAKAAPPSAPSRRSRPPTRAARSTSGKLARKAVPKKQRRKPPRRG